MDHDPEGLLLPSIAIACWPTLHQWLGCRIAALWQVIVLVLWLGCL
jgi:hypothetical protein